MNAPAKAHSNELYVVMSILLLSTFSMVGLLMLGITLWLTAMNIDIARTHLRGEAVVVSSQRNGPPSTRHATYDVRVRHEVDGRWYTATASHATTSYDPGDRIAIYYKPESPYRIELGTLMGRWFMPLVCAAIAAMFLGGVLRELVLLRRQRLAARRG